MNQRRFITAIAAAMLAISACGDSPAATTLPATTAPTTIAATPVSGYAHAGPVCPVAQIPPDPECDDRPVVDAGLLVVDDGAAIVAEARTGADGRFEVLVPPGTYTLVPQPVDGLLGTAAPQEFTVGPGSPPELDVAYDTGIR
ncbi:MAG: carboxypeptidase-like regulatory domain-containing protein [Acidimicrobiia bacterium]|nr:carboxypeptidase-like regulatory domain-containing protein [Acidimicrobiia bacterium]